MANHLVIVANTLEPYGYELIRILAVPNGFRHRFRFESEWVDHGVVSKPPIPGSIGYIVLRDFETAKLYPIRGFKVASFAQVGTINYLECELSELFDFDSDASRRTTEFEAFNVSFNNIRREITESNLAGQHMKPLVFETGVAPAITNANSRMSGDNDREHEKWNNLIQSLKRVPFYSGIDFLRLLHVNAVGQTDPVNIVNGQFRLVEQERYTVLLAQQRVAGGDAQFTRDIKLSTDPLNMSAVRGINRAVGKYDVLSFEICVRAIEESTPGFFEIEFTPDERRAPHIDPRIHFPVTLARRRPNYGSRFLGLAIFALAYLLPDITSAFEASLPTWIKSIADGRFLQDLSIVGFTLMIVDLMRVSRK